MRITTFLKTTPLTPTTSCPRPTLDLESEEKHAFTSAGTNQLEQRPRPGPPGRLSRGVGRTCHKMIEKENVVFEAGNSLLVGARTRHCPQQAWVHRGEPGPLWGKTRTKHAARGRGVGCGVSTSATASGNSSAGTTGSTKDAGNLGSMRRLWKCGGWVAPFSTPAPSGACGRRHQLQACPRQ